MTETSDLRGLKILLSEGSSLSAREIVTALGRLGCRVELCDPDPMCIARFSRYVSRFRRCPPLAADPGKYLDFVVDLLSKNRFDIFLPVHEQAFLFARFRDRLPREIKVALAPFASFERALGKIPFARICRELCIPHPETIDDVAIDFIAKWDRYPFFVKTSIGTASRGVWAVRSPEDRDRTVSDLKNHNLRNETLLLQQGVRGPLERIQAVFDCGRLVAWHGYRQMLEGMGGGDAIKRSILRPEVRRFVEKIGSKLEWHGALSFDYIFEEEATRPMFIDCNPRLVEPVNALLCGADLTASLIRVSLGEMPPVQPAGREGITTHMAILSLLGMAGRGASRIAILNEFLDLVRGRGSYSGSREELTPYREDPLSLVPLLFVVSRILLRPATVKQFADRNSRSHQLTGTITERIQNHPNIVAN